MIETTDLGRSYNGKAALRSLTLRVEPGEILGFLGPNGAGKSTTVKILTGLLAPGTGRASICGYDITTQPLEAKTRLGYVPEQPVLYESLTAPEFLDVMACLHHLPPDIARTRRGELLELFGLGGNQDRLGGFSKGMKQKVVLASALMHRPDVMILDEPLDGLDANTAMVVKDLLRKLAAQGCAILFCSHILEVVERVCTRILVIDKGRQVAEGSPADIAAAVGATSLDDAFARITGVRDAGLITSDILKALERA
jgi:ABC-2 type transport system ATP-binding protein